MTPTILLSAFVVHPDMPSEPGVGWQFLLAAAQHASTVGARVRVVTNRRSEIACRGRIPAPLDEVVTVDAVDIPGAPPFFRWHYPRFTRVEHELWVRLAARHIRRVVPAAQVVYAHHVTFASEILGAPITSLDTYRVWGPVGAGGVADVFALAPTSAAARRQRRLQRARDASARYPAMRVARRCDLVLTQNEAVEELLGTVGTPTRRFPNVVVEASDGPGGPPPRAADAPRRSTTEAPCLLTVGHLIPRKRQELVIDALTSPLLREARLDVVGFDDTAHARYLRSLADELGVSERVRFLGHRSRSDVRSAMLAADVLVHPSGREGASGVVGEAASCGLPVVAFAGTGAASVLQDSGTPGVVVQARDRPGRDDLAAAVLRAAAMPRRSTAQWSTDRLVALSERLWADGLARRTAPTR
ncbi:glycosyltransferase [Rhodococcus sp. NPDC003994]